MKHFSSLVACAAAVLALTATAQQGPRFPVTAQQRGTAQQVASQGVPLAELAPNAPEVYVVRRGDTLWSIAGLYLRSPWRWPELWGMNLNDIRNPHLIYPGQELVLERENGYARLRARRTGDDQIGQTIRVSPRNRVEMLDASPLRTLKPHLIEPFLAEPLVVQRQATFEQAPRIVATTEKAVLLSKGDRAYARGPAGEPLELASGLPTNFRVFRNAKPLKDPVTGEILGYEGQYVGQAKLLRGESAAVQEVSGTRVGPMVLPLGGTTTVETPVPASVDISFSKEEIRAGDRLLPEPPRQQRSYAPRAPDMEIEARVVSLYGSSLRVAGQNQVVAINRGAEDGLEAGHVLAVLNGGRQMVDKTDPNAATIQLPDERNGLGMVFLVFDRVSYVLLMEVNDPVEVGDKLVNPK